jgi:hypothetical protein
MIIALAFVSGLQGMENPNKCTSLSLTLGECVTQKGKMILHLDSNKYEQFTIENLITSSLGHNFAQSKTIILSSGATVEDFNGKFLSKDKRWIKYDDYMYDFEGKLGQDRPVACVLYNIVDDKSARYFIDMFKQWKFAELWQRRDRNNGEAKLINLHTSGIQDKSLIVNILNMTQDFVPRRGDMPKDVAQLLCAVPQRVVYTVPQEVVSGDGGVVSSSQSEDLALNANKENANAEAVASLVKATKALVEESKASDKKQLGRLAAFSNFLTNHWGKIAVGGVSLAVLFAYYYNFVRQ